MKYLKYILLPVLLIVSGCVKENNDDGISLEGTANYRFMASISDTALETRVSLDPDDHGHGNGHMHNLALHWEEGDVVELTPSDAPEVHYLFTANKYIYDTATKAFVDEEGENTKVMYIFESTSTDIPSPFTGTAVYIPSESLPTTEEELKVMKDDGTIETKKSPVFTQTTDGDTQHLKCCQSMKATLTNVPLTLSAGAWADDDYWDNIADIKTPIVFQCDGEYAYLKIELNKFYYTIYGKGNLFLYDMDETTPIDDNEDLPEYETPIAKMTFGTTKSTEYINVPKYDTETDKSEFDADTQYYLGDEVVGTFYLPVQKYAVKGGHYLAAVLQCGSSGDLYVYEKKVVDDMTFEPGKLYTLDYTDRKVEYAMCVKEDVTYLRSTYLEQDDNGDAPRYTLFGEKAELGKPSNHPNRAVGRDGFDKEDVREMINNHGATYIVSTEICSISPLFLKTWKFTWSGDKWNWDKKTGIDGKKYYMIPTGDLSPVNVNKVNTYMRKLTKGIINPNATNTIGEITSFEKDGVPTLSIKNCYELVLKDKFDPVLHSAKTSKLWRRPTGRDIYLLTDSGYFSYELSSEKLIITKINSKHKIAISYLYPYAGGGSRGTDISGTTGASSGTWTKSTGGTARTKVFHSSSVRSFGSNNPAYMQMNIIGYENEKFALVTNFDVATPVLPVFRWKITTENEDFIPWSKIDADYKHGININYIYDTNNNLTYLDALNNFYNQFVEAE